MSRDPFRPFAPRRYVFHRDVRAGCETCDITWRGGNAQGVAARHHDATNHETWVEVEMHIRYGGKITKVVAP